MIKLPLELYLDEGSSQKVRQNRQKYSDFGTFFRNRSEFGGGFDIEVDFASAHQYHLEIHFL